MAVQRQLRALTSDRNLRRFVVPARPTGRQLGTGSYGTVEEVELNGLVCAGKKIHEILLDVGNVGVQDIATKYVQECQLMSDLRHPNITLFLGLCFLPDCQLPVLVMERLDGSLDDLLETVPNIPLTLKRSMLEDVARGLLYLHKHDPQIIHRDLTSKNVLLTPSLVAKITDLGNSRIVNIQSGQLAQTLSRNPGTLVYMPPEALNAAARYGPSLDIFSFGHLGIFVGLQIFPGNLLEPTYMDPEDRHRLVARSEVERRSHYIGQLENKLPSGEHHPFIRLVKRCLHNDLSERPTSEQLVTSLEEMKADIEGPYGEVARIDAVRQVVMMRALKRRERQVREKTDESAAKDEEINQLQQELEHEQAELGRANEQLQQKNAQIREKDVQIQQKDAQLQQKDVQIQQKDAHIQRQAVELQQKVEQLQQKDVQAGQLAAELQQKDSELNSVRENLQRLHSDLENRKAQLKAQEVELKRRDAEISRLMEKLRRYQAQIHGQQTSLAELKLSLELQWKQGEVMPFAMANCQAVAIDGNVYVGGGESYTSAQVVMVYSTCTGLWGTLPPYDSKWFGMAAVNDQLVLVGGSELSSRKATNMLGVWDEGSQTWTHPFPEMPMPRHSPSVVSYQRWLVIAGGVDGKGFYQNKVELLDTKSKQWYEGSPLPKGCSQMSSTINGNMWYLSGGIYSALHQPNQQVFCVCLNELISQAISQSLGAMLSSILSPWQTMTDTPVVHSTTLIFSGALLAIGVSAIFLYQPSSGNWIQVVDLPTMRSQCACVVLKSGEIFVVGGQNALLYCNYSRQCVLLQLSDKNI